MRIVGLCWYLSGACAVALALSLLITYAPGAEPFAVALQEASAYGSVTAAAGAIALARLPPGHWVHRSRPLWATLAGLAVAVTLLVVLAG